MRYADAASMAEDGTLVADLRLIGALEPDVGDRQEQGPIERVSHFQAAFDGKQAVADAR